MRLTMRARRFISLFSACVAAALVGVAAASTVIAGGGDSPQDPGPPPGTAVVDSRAPDPAGGPEWATRRYSSQSGEDCVEVGRYDGRDFGSIDASGRVRPLPPGRGGPCGDLGAEPAIVAVNRHPAVDTRPARTVLFGVASDEVSAIRTGTPDGGTQTLPLGAARTFLLVTSGLHEETSFPVDVELGDGSVVTHRWR